MLIRMLLYTTKSPGPQQILTAWSPLLDFDHLHAQ